MAAKGKFNNEKTHLKRNQQVDFLGLILNFITTSAAVPQGKL